MNSQALSPLERGNIYFFYRPKIGKEVSQSLEDVQHFFFILQNHKVRQIMIGKKSLPQAAEVNFGFIETVSSVPQEVGSRLEEEQYETKTRGKRTVSEARLIAEGKYCLIRHKKNVHLIYQLEKPKSQKEVQSAFHIGLTGNFIINVKNPTLQTEAGLASKQRAQFPKKLQEKFEHRRFIPLDPPAFLDYEGAEILLIGEKAKLDKEWEMDIKEQFSSFSHEEAKKAFNTDKHPISTQPLTGQWE